MDLAAGFAGVTLWQLAIVAGMALFASVVGGIAGYGTGVLMPLVLVPITGAETVVPIIAITALFTNSSRAIAFRDSISVPRTAIVLAGAIPTCVLGAYGFTLLTGRGALFVIGATLMPTRPAAPPHAPPRHGARTARPVRQRGRLWRAGRRHDRIRRDPALDADGVGPRGRGGDRDRRGDLDRRRLRQDRGVRRCRHHRCEGARRSR